MADTCVAPDGKEMWTFGLTSKLMTVVLTLTLAFIPLTIFIFGPKLLFYVGGTFGYYLRKKTEGRRARILETVEKDEKEFAEKGERRDSEEWESVDAYAVGTARNGEKGDKEWDGIVGFFHPFWWALQKLFEKMR